LEFLQIRPLSGPNGRFTEGEKTHFSFLHYQSIPRSLTGGTHRSAPLPRSERGRRVGDGERAVAAPTDRRPGRRRASAQNAKTASPRRLPDPISLSLTCSLHPSVSRWVRVRHGRPSIELELAPAPQPPPPAPRPHHRVRRSLAHLQHLTSPPFSLPSARSGSLRRTTSAVVTMAGRGKLEASSPSGALHA